ncbi:MAG: AAA family ATPase [Candidatus Dormibacteria bacterium]
MSESSTLSGPKVLLIGPSGTGKTRALGTLVDWAARQSPPRNVNILFTENGLETLLGYWTDRKLPVPPNLRYHVITTQSIPLKDLLDAAKKVGILSYKSITEMVDPNRASNNPYYKILEVFSKFTDDRTGKDFGNIGEWGNEEIFGIDSLTELANACMKMVIGNKPTASPSDYGVAQNNLMNLLRFLTQGFAPTLVMTAHVQRQQDEMTGSVKLMVKAIGKAMSDDIPQLFSETIGTIREGANWYWDTARSDLDTKTRYLPIASKISPDFAQIMDKWQARSKG